MNELLVKAAIVLAIGGVVLFGNAQAAENISEKQCTGMNDKSFKCAAWLGATTALDLASQKEMHTLSAEACVQVIKDQIAKGQSGNKTYNDGVNKAEINVTKHGVIDCKLSGL